MPKTRRFTLTIVLLCLPFLATAVVAGAHLRGSLQHREAVEEAAVKMARVMLKDVFDVAFNHMGRGLLPVWRSGYNPVVERSLREGRQPGVDEVAAMLERVVDSLGACECMANPVPMLGVAALDPVSREVAVGGERTGLEGWRERFEAFGPDTRLTDGTLRTMTGTDERGPWFAYFLPVDREGPHPLVLAVEIDLERMGDVVVRPIHERVARRDLRDSSGVADPVGLRIVHPAGAVVYESGPVGQGPSYEMPLFGRDLGSSSVANTRPFSATLSIHPDALPALIPGGLPGSPWPLVVSTLLGAALLTGLGLLLLLRIRQVVEMREHFVSSVSHELRTPLSQILAYAETLQLDRPTPEARRRAATVIVRETRRLAHLVENALAFVRGERPDVTLDPVPMRLDRALEGADHDLAELARRRGATLDVELEPGLTGVLDPSCLHRILLNLVDNALRYGPRGQTVRLTGRRRGPWIELAVDDEGPGVPADERERIWEPFQRLRRGTDDTGTGLGLAIVKQLVELQKGEVAVEERSSGGARFVVRLPAAGVGSPAGTRGGAEPTGGGAPSSPGPGRPVPDPPGAAGSSDPEPDPWEEETWRAS